METNINYPPRYPLPGPYSLGKLMKWKHGYFLDMTTFVGRMSLLVRETNEMETKQCTLNLLIY